jgi:hypothetical protein
MSIKALQLTSTSAAADLQTRSGPKLSTSALGGYFIVRIIVCRNQQRSI